MTVTALSKKYANTVILESASLALEHGHVTCLTGRNGSGKTTLLNLIGGQDRADSGSIALNGIEVSRMTAPQRAILGIGRAFQHAQLFPEWTVFESYQFALHAMSGHGKRIPPRVTLETLGLEDLHEKPVASLPSSKQKLLDILLAFLVGTEVVLLDEPTAGVEVSDIERILEACILACEGSSASVMVVDHKESFIRMLEGKLQANRLELRDGRFCAPSSGFIKRAHHE